MKLTAATSDLTDSVGFHDGKKCPNNPADVKLVKKLLNKFAKQIGLTTLLDVTSAEVGAKTRQAILAFQRIVMRLRSPTERVRPIAKGGKMLKALMTTNPVSPNQWSGDPAKWSQSQKLMSMNSHFRQKIQKILAAMKKRGFKPKIVYAWRSVAIQLKLFKAGKTKVKFSFHNAQHLDGTPNAYAVDIVDERWAWSADAETNGFWEALGEEAKKMGQFWGGDWASFPDVAHIQYYPNSSLRRVKKASGL